MESDSECIKQEQELSFSQRKHQNRKSFSLPKTVYPKLHMIILDKIWIWDAQHDQEEEVEVDLEEEEEEVEDLKGDDLSKC